MYSFYNIDRLLRGHYDATWRRRTITYAAQPYSRIKRYIDDLLTGNPSIIGVPGVPGAGKTTFYGYALADYLKDYICKNEKLDTLYVYLAPTNDLLIDFLEKFLGFLKGAFQVDCKPEELMRRIRVYGSKIESDDYRQVFKPIDDEVLLVISTEWQRVSARVRNARRQVYLIDEASRMTVSRLFISIADGIARRRPGEDIVGFAVIGDVNQAVGLDEKQRLWLLLRNVERLAEGSDLVHIIPLTISWRIPAGTEEPIKVGYYNNQLEAKGTPITLRADFEEVKKVISDSSREKICKKYENIIYEFLDLSSKYPHVHIELDKHFVAGERYDEKRAELAWCLARVISKAGPRRHISVVVPYNQMAFAVRILGRLEGVRAATVASYLGREDDIIISVFGKEQVGGCNTYYLQDPYIPNVQHSRQRNALYTIGSTEVLKYSVDACRKQIMHSPGGVYKRELAEGFEKLYKMIEELQNLDKRIITARI